MEVTGEGSLDEDLKRAGEEQRGARGIITVYGFHEPLQRVYESSSLENVLKAIKERGYAPGHLCQSYYRSSEGHLQIRRGTNKAGLVISEGEGRKMNYVLYLLVSEAKSFEP